MTVAFVMERIMYGLKREQWFAWLSDVSLFDSREI